MPRTIICSYCGRVDVLGGGVIEARLVGGLALAPRCLNRGDCLQRRMQAAMTPSPAYSSAFAAVREARP